MDAVRLHDGTQVEIRPIAAGDGPALSAAYDRLSDETKYRRFMAVKPHLTGTDVRYLTRIDGSRHVALVATLAGRSDQIIAVARFVRLPNDPHTAEFAIVVGDPHQGKGLGSALMERLAATAVEQGVKRFIGTMLADNVPAHRLTNRLAGQLAHERHLGPVDELEVELTLGAGGGALRDVSPA
jgi:RimJ/RimL family protein N-acetyltransferase